MPERKRSQLGQLTQKFFFSNTWVAKKKLFFSLHQQYRQHHLQTTSVILIPNVYFCLAHRVYRQHLCHQTLAEKNCHLQIPLCLNKLQVVFFFLRKSLFLNKIVIWTKKRILTPLTT